MMQFSVHALEIGQCDFLLQNHMEESDKETVEQASVEDA
jgi:hypothetical protein